MMHIDMDAFYVYNYAFDLSCTGCMHRLLLYVSVTH